MAHIWEAAPTGKSYRSGHSQAGMHAWLLRLGTAQGHYVESPPPVDFFYCYHCYNFPVVTGKHLLLTVCLLKQFYNRWKYSVLGEGSFFFYFVQPWGSGYSSCFHIFPVGKTSSYFWILLLWVLADLGYSMCSSISLVIRDENSAGRRGSRSQEVKGTAESQACPAPTELLSLLCICSLVLELVFPLARKWLHHLQAQNFWVSPSICWKF